MPLAVIMAFNCLPLLEHANALCVYRTYKLEMNPMVADKDRVMSCAQREAKRPRLSSDASDTSDASRASAISGGSGVSLD